MERKETIEIMKRVKAVYQNFILSKEVVDTWDEILMNEDFENVKKNFMDYVKNDRSGKVPTFAHLIRGIK